MAGAAAASLCVYMRDVAASHLDKRGAGSKFAEVNGKRARAVKFSESAEPISDASGKDGELGTRGQLMTTFQFGRREEADGEASDFFSGGWT